MTPRNIFIKFTNEALGWVSAAEGFVFLSGLTAGLVYTYKYLEKGDQTIKTATRNRSWLIYKYHILLFFLVLISVFSSGFLQDYWASEYQPILSKPLTTTLLATTLLYQPNFLDILPMYAVFVLFIPVIVCSFERGIYKPVLAISGLLYLIGTFRTLSYLGLSFPSDTINTGFFDLLSWQLLFVIGLYLGSLYYHGRTEKLQKSNLLFYAALLFALPVFVIKFFYIDLGSFDISYWADKSYLRPIRVINFAAILIIVTHVATRFDTWFHYKPICTLGKYSLEVFAFHIVLLILLKPVEQYLNSFSVINISNHFSLYPLGTLLIVVVLLLLFLIPKLMGRKKVTAVAPLEKVV